MGEIAVVGIGNPYVSDDGMGYHVLRELRKRVRDPRVVFIELVACSIDTLDHLKGFEEAVIIDAAKTGSVPVGCIRRICPYETSSSFHSLSLHTLGLQSALGLGSMLGLPLPRTINLFAVEVVDTETFHEGCTPEVEAAIPSVVAYTVDFLKSRLPDLGYSDDTLHAMETACS
jgi:hydrogenase maturation protease